MLSDSIIIGLILSIPPKKENTQILSNPIIIMKIIKIKEGNT
jgi:hypothetical protein